MLLQNCLWIGLAGCWAGVLLAGNLVAAPAKFQVSSLDLSLALQVGRAQFMWIGYVEWVLFFTIILALLLHLRIPPVLLIIVGVIFLMQRLYLQPALQERSNLIIAGHTPQGSSMHVIFTILEIGKFLFLAIFTALSLYQLSKV